MTRLSTGALLVVAVALAGFTATAVFADSREGTSPLLIRAQLTKWPLPTRNPPPRIERDEHGRVVSLMLDGMLLEPGDVDMIRSFRHLKRLSLSYTTISDQELARLADLPRLEGIRLNYTGIGDDGVASLAKFPQLKSVCMFKVHASPASVRALKAERRQLGIGYVPLGN
jgi:hypothetical protein